jgi:hypothetical protein
MIHEGPALLRSDWLVTLWWVAAFHTGLDSNVEVRYMREVVRARPVCVIHVVVSWLFKYSTVAISPPTSQLQFLRVGKPPAMSGVKLKVREWWG